MATDRPQPRGTAANIEITENPRLTGPGHRRHLREEAFIARNVGRMEQNKEENTSGIVTEHTRPGTVIMYKPTETQGYVARRVSVSALRPLILQGWSEFCPDCGAEHLDRNGNVTTDPNACKVRPPVAVRVCPICQKRIYDNQGLPVSPAEDGYIDPNVIPDEGAVTTPAGRTRILLDLHLWAKHPRHAQMLGRPPLPLAMREIAESVQASIA